MKTRKGFSVIEIIVFLVIGVAMAFSVSSIITPHKEPQKTFAAEACEGGDLYKNEKEGRLCDEMEDFELDEK